MPITSQIPLSNISGIVFWYARRRETRITRRTLSPESCFFWPCESNYNTHEKVPQMPNFKMTWPFKFEKFRNRQKVSVVDFVMVLKIVILSVLRGSQNSSPNGRWLGVSDEWSRLSATTWNHSPHSAGLKCNDIDLEIAKDVFDIYRFDRISTLENWKDNGLTSFRDE